MSENEKLNTADGTRNGEGRHVFHLDNRDGLLSYEGDGGEVNVPEGVKYIQEEAFAFCNHVTGVTLPEGVQVIAKRAFFKSGIRTITLPNSLTRIEECAFSDTPLESIYIPEQATKLEELAFSGAKVLKSVRLPKGVMSVNPGMFAGCVSLEEIELPEGLKFIQGKAFLNCSNLKRITLPASLVAVWVQAFEGCSSLQEIFLPDGTEAVGYAAFKNCKELKRVRIPKGMKQFNCDAFEGAEKVELVGPGAMNGLIIIDGSICCTAPGLKRVIFSEGTSRIDESTVQALRDPEVLDLPRSLQYYYWQALAQFASLKEIVTDRDAQAAEIPFMLDLKCTDREGKQFTLKMPERDGEWVTKPDGDGGIIILGRTGSVGRVGDAPYAGVVIPEEIDGKPVTGIGAAAFCENDDADAFYIPDSVKTIGSKAFARMGVNRHYERLFVRMPKGISMAEDAFEDTDYFTKEDACGMWLGWKPAADESVPEASFDTHFAERAADDPLIGTGAGGCSELKPNIWQYFDRLSRDERARELTHSFEMSGGIDGVGWASVCIDVDDESTEFRISYIGSSLADFKRFANDIEDGEEGRFAWASEPGSYPWTIQRRGGILYVSAPNIQNGFFIPRDQFLEAASGMTAEWRY